jgi:lipoprotein-anchoring transpeptidase ErfK/SrfK
VRFASSSRALAVAASLIALCVGGAGCGSPKRRAAPVPQSSVAAPSPVVSAAEPIPVAVAAPAGLHTISYLAGPQGLPADPSPTSEVPVASGLKPATGSTVVLYDAPGGVPRAHLPADISGVPVTVPIVARQTGWVAVLTPTANRTIGWVPPGGWTEVPLRDRLVVRRGTHQLTWYREGTAKESWTVTLGSPSTPTPLGRTFVLGRSTLSGSVYAGLDVLALGAVPDDRNAVAPELAGAHVGIHAWYRNEFGRNISNGCVRMPPAAQSVLLAEIIPGTEVMVLD